MSEPVAAAHTSFGLSGLTTMRANEPLSGSPESCHDAPPSWDVYRPSPMNVEPPPDGLEPSPVPAYSVPSEPRASAPTAWVLCTGQAGVQTLPPSTDLNTPPLPTEAYTVLGLVVGSIARSVTRPATFAGPTNCQRDAPVASGSASACAAARWTCAAVTAWPDDASRSRNDCGPWSASPAPFHAGAAAARWTVDRVTERVVATPATARTPTIRRTTSRRMPLGSRAVGALSPCSCRRTVATDLTRSATS